MIYESQSQQPWVNVFPNGGNGNSGDSFGNNGAWWIIILFLFAMMGGWGNNGSSRGGYDGQTYVPFAMPNYGGSVQQGFDQAAIMGGINGIQNSVSTGFANAEVSRCNTQANILQTLNNNQNATNNSMNSLAMSLQNCCCENRAATADLKYTVATEACADRAAVNDALQAVTAQSNANTQKIIDMMCQNTIDAKNEKIADLQQQLTMAQLAASQNAQTAAILTDNLAQTNAIEQYLAPVPRPAYVVQNPNCCASFGTCNSCGR